MFTDTSASLCASAESIAPTAASLIASGEYLSSTDCTCSLARSARQSEITSTSSTRSLP